MNAVPVSIVPKLREILVREVRVGDLLEALIIVGPLGAVYFVSAWKLFPISV